MPAEKVEIVTDNGTTVKAIAPVIISASRSTDIPAYSPKWFISRFNSGRGYVKWFNPFNQKPVFVSFEKTKVIVFWSKNPKPLIPYLPELDAAGLHYYFQFTLNDYQQENLEPNIPSVESRIQTFKKLASLIGPERLIWRFDPVLFTKTLTPREVAARIFKISKELKGCTNRLVFSFIDIKAYKKVQRNLLRYSEHFTSQYDSTSICEVEPSAKQVEEFAGYLSKIRAFWKERGWNLELCICAEKFDLSHDGILSSKCIDGELMLKVFGNDAELADYLTKAPIKPSFELDQLDLFNSTLPEKEKIITIKKDSGQRQECGCVESKDIGMYNTCLHGCVYCYANTSPELAIKNFERRKNHPMAESIFIPDFPKA
ncbi:DUF1848 domain-containing protein [uncultured Parasutterella sp.]|uniref:DUF1848 domain-containing protein n=1 Tax=uncultured Parasutterella sp. TaxID=1263098 RepID=UPI0025E086D6|nr:DUF1848 domain-containing protein [uncultured Parasutterella sp.]